MLVIDDGSTDGTGDVVSSNLTRFPNVRLLVNERNMGFGWSYRRGVDAATLDHIVMVHGDNAWGCETLQEFFEPRRRRRRHHRLHSPDVPVAHVDAARSSRRPSRWLVNLITRRRLQYYNGLQIHRASRAQEPADRVDRLRISGRGARQEPAADEDLRRSADGPDRAEAGREQGVPRQERHRRARRRSCGCARSSGRRRQIAPAVRRRPDDDRVVGRSVPAAAQDRSG